MFNKKESQLKLNDANMKQTQKAKEIKILWTPYVLNTLSFASGALCCNIVVQKIDESKFY